LICPGGEIPHAGEPSPIPHSKSLDWGNDQEQTFYRSERRERSGREQKTQPRHLTTKSAYNTKNRRLTLPRWPCASTLDWGNDQEQTFYRSERSERSGREQKTQPGDLAAKERTERKGLAGPGSSRRNDGSIVNALFRALDVQNDPSYGDPFQAGTLSPGRTVAGDCNLALNGGSEPTTRWRFTQRNSVNDSKSPVPYRVVFLQRKACQPPARTCLPAWPGQRPRHDEHLLNSWKPRLASAPSV
jgi:hypothetical protein